MAFSTYAKAAPIRPSFAFSTTITPVLRRILMLLFIPRSLCALKRVAAKAEHARFGATQGIRIALRSGLYRAEATDGRRAIVVQGLTPIEDPPWPGFKEIPGWSVVANTGRCCSWRMAPRLRLSRTCRGQRPGRPDPAPEIEHHRPTRKETSCEFSPSCSWSSASSP
jgi:hypothetical protein